MAVMKNNNENTMTVNVVSRNFPVTEAMQTAIDKHIENVASIYDRINRCEVVISTPHHHQHKGRVYHIAVKLEIPGPDVIVNREAERNPAHTDFYIALGDTFDTVERQLRDHVQKLRGFVKVREKRLESPEEP